MTVEEAIRQRRSHRRFLPTPIPVTEIREMLTLASLAPSAGNRQMWRYIVVTDEALRAMLVRVIEHKIDAIAAWPEFANRLQRVTAWKEHALHFASAPVLVIIVNEGYTSPLDKVLIEHGVKYAEVTHMFAHPEIQSNSGMVAYLNLLATERGYGCCWMTEPLIAQKELQATLQLKGGEEVLAFLTMGKPADTPLPKPRKPIDELIEWR